MIISDGNKTTDAGIESEIIQGDDVSLEGVVDESIGTTTQEEATTEATTEKVDSVYTTTKITVTSGMTSYDVALMLQNAGIIDDCVDFDSYLLRYLLILLVIVYNLSSNFQIRIQEQ